MPDSAPASPAPYRPVSTHDAPRLRFAPSPNGRLHEGHAYSALLNHRAAHARGGRFLIRIEDIDAARCPPDLCRAALDDLAWLGLISDEPVLFQSQRGAAYAAMLDRLKARGLVYPCRCTRGEIAAAIAEREAAKQPPWPRDPDGAPLYPGTCRHLEPAQLGNGPFAWRLDVAKALVQPEVTGAPLHFAVEDAAGARAVRVAEPERWGDVVLARRDIGTSYHLAVVVDDAFQHISHVVRGQDLEAATDIHVLLQRLLGLPTPVYGFHGLLRDAEGEKLAKSRNSTSLDDLRRAGLTPEAIRARLGF